MDRRGQVSGIGSLRIYDLSDPAHPTQVEEYALPYPRSIQLVSGYSYVRPVGKGQIECNIQQTPPPPLETWPAQEQLAPGRVFDDAPGFATDYHGCINRDRTLLVVLGGWAGLFQVYVRVLDVTDPTNIFVLSDGPISANPLATAAKLKWSPPLFAFLASPGEANQVEVFNLQAEIFGYWLTPEQWAMMPFAGGAGLDADGDGSYVGPTDLLPMPSRALRVERPGYVTRVYATGTNQVITDYSLDGKRPFVGATLAPGAEVDDDGNYTIPVGPAYRTLLSAGLQGANLPKERAALALMVESADAVLVLLGATIQIQAAHGSPIFWDRRDLALVAASVASSSDPRLFVVDVGDPLNPTIIGDPAGIRLETSLDRVDRIERDPVDPNLVSAFRERTVLDPDRPARARPGHEPSSPGHRGGHPHHPSLLLARRDVVRPSRQRTSRRSSLLRP